MPKILLKEGLVVNRGEKEYLDILISKNRIERIDRSIPSGHADIVNLDGKWVFPGIIDDQVHFREPGYTHKANIASESRAALLGGITSFMEMPNTSPAATNHVLLEEKYEVASKCSPCNYSFYIGATNDNIDELLKTNAREVCGIKIFMGSSTGDLLVDNLIALEKTFKEAHLLVATHCEDEMTILHNLEVYQKKYGSNLEAKHHPMIRSADGCYKSSSHAVALAKKHGTRLHVLHITTEMELGLFDNSIPLIEKHITSEVCVHHLYFNDGHYDSLGNKIKCNPAIKSTSDQASLFKGLLDDRLDIIATDHAPHTIEEKSKNYLQAPSGLPLVQHSLSIMLDFYNQGKLSLEEIIRKMCHAPSDCFSIHNRGYLDEGYFADILVVDPKKRMTINEVNIAYKCGWSPLEGKSFQGVIEQVYVNGQLKVKNGLIINESSGDRLLFDR